MNINERLQEIKETLEWGNYIHIVMQNGGIKSTANFTHHAAWMYDTINQLQEINETIFARNGELVAEKYELEKRVAFLEKELSYFTSEFYVKEVDNIENVRREE